MGILRVSFEILNELYTAIGAGPLGLVFLVFESSATVKNVVKTLSVTAVTFAGLFYVFRCNEERITVNRRKVVMITGCDTGLGFSLAQHTAEIGFTVIATFLDLNSPGSQQLSQWSAGRIEKVQLNLTDKKSIESVIVWLNVYFESNPNHTLHALINNAGTMVFGEFEWQTPRLIQQQIDVNFLGPLTLTNALAPLVRQFKGRIINFSSHCAYQNLPGLCVYGGTKAALHSWSDGLRIEMAQYGVKVIILIPGSFAGQSSIMQRHIENVREMHDSFSKEQHRFYTDYFKRYNIYLSHAFTPSLPSSHSTQHHHHPEMQTHEIQRIKKIESPNFYAIYDNALLLREPDFIYKNEPLRYAIYHFLFKISPRFLRDYLVVNFMLMPRYNDDTNQFNKIGKGDTDNDDGDDYLEVKTLTDLRSRCDCYSDD